jgi:hypothetical protein
LSDLGALIESLEKPMPASPEELLELDIQLAPESVQAEVARLRQVEDKATRTLREIHQTVCQALLKEPNKREDTMALMDVRHLCEHWERRNEATRP